MKRWIGSWILTCGALTAPLWTGCTGDTTAPVVDGNSIPSVGDDTSNPSEAGDRNSGESPAELQRTSAADDASAGLVSSATTQREEIGPEELARRQESREAFATLMKTETTPEDWEASHVRLVELGASSVPVLAEKLQSEVPFERETASSLLALLGPLATDAADELAAAMQDSSGYVRANAAAALAQIPGRGDETIAVFAELILASDPQLRRMATTNLAAFGPPAPALVPNLTEALQGNDAEALLSAVELLGRIGPPARTALPRLQQIAFETTDDESLKNAARQAVAQIEAETSEE
ncbi:MAG: HEAT repeat domain-containing protein [Planctomycetaceae bacterium]